MNQKRIVKCPNCATFNTNKDYCENCNTLISHQKKRELIETAVKQKEVDRVVEKINNPNFVERLKKHPFFFFRGIGWVLFSAIMVVSAIGAGLAWFIAMVAAG